MMVIRGNLAANVLGSGIAAGTYILPAERCVWQQVDSAAGGGYRVTNVRYLSGTGTIEAAVTGTPLLGYIGKSGRFVAVSDAT